jgi:hypothetical protein
LEGSVAAQYENSWAPLGGLSAGFHSEFLRITRKAKLDQPPASIRKFLERGENILREPSSRGRIHKD